MLLMVEKVVRVGIGHRHLKTNDKYMNNYNKKIDSSKMYQNLMKTL